MHVHFPFSNNLIVKYIFVAMQMSPLCSSTFWIVVTTLQTLANYNSSSWPLAKNQNHHVTSTSHKVLTTYAISYMRCVATLAIRNTWKKKSLISMSNMTPINTMCIQHSKSCLMHEHTLIANVYVEGTLYSFNNINFLFIFIQHVLRKCQWNMWNENHPFCVHIQFLCSIQSFWHAFS
jgi:hypothetical protein